MKIRIILLCLGIARLLQPEMCWIVVVAGLPDLYLLGDLANVVRFTKNLTEAGFIRPATRRERFCRVAWRSAV